MENNIIKMSCNEQSNPLAEGGSDPINVEQEEENETHEALLNDVVLQNIFKYLGYKDLKSCRDVKNSQWLQNSKKVWWARSKVGFENDENAETRFVDYLNQDGILSNATNFRFGALGENSIRLLNSLADSIKYLEIKVSYRMPLDEFRQIIYARCPNMEKLVVHYLERIPDFPDFPDLPTRHRNRNQNQNGIVEPLEWQTPRFGEHKNLKCFESSGYLPVSWMELLSHYPNLQALKVHARNGDIYKTISTIRKHNPKMLKLNRIDIYGFQRERNDDYDQSYRLVYLDPKVSLKKLNIDFDIRQGETLADILELHANSLEELNVSQRDNNPTKQLSLRKPLQALEELSIINCFFPVDNFKYTPNLRKVYLSYEGPQNLFQAAESIPSINTCKVLKIRIHKRGCDDSTTDMKFFINAFPNVETFQTSKLSNLEFSSICERWVKLRSFHVGWGSQVDVTGLLGYDPDSKASNGIRRPNITNLKDLQSFSVISDFKYEGIMCTRNLSEMKNGSVVLEELEGLQQLKYFKFENYLWKGEQM